MPEEASLLFAAYATLIAAAAAMLAAMFFEICFRHADA